VTVEVLLHHCPCFYKNRDTGYSTMLTSPEPFGQQGLNLMGYTAVLASEPAATQSAGPRPSSRWQDALPAPAPDEHSLAERWWPWFLLAMAFHAVTLAVVAYCAVLDLPNPEEPLMAIGVIDLVGLGGGGGAGGDGRESGAAGTTSGETAAAQGEAPTAPAEQAASEETRKPEEQAPMPAESLSPVIEKPRETPPPPKPQPAPKPRRAARPQSPPIQTADAAQPSSAAVTTGTAQGTQAGTISEPGTGTGLAGEGTGKGHGQTPGEGGGGSGEGKGVGGGVYEGQFGHGDGPKFRHRTLPHYPDEAKRSGKEGSVSLRLRIDAAGVLCDVSVINHCGVEFVEEAVRAIRASTFYPATHNGQPMPCNAVLTIRFKLG